MRLIDADALKEDFKARLEKAKNWKENALNNSDDELVIRATATIDFICEVIMTINNAPTVEIPVARWDCYCEGQKVGYEKALSESSQGEWIDYDNTFYKCPDCGYLLEKCCPQCQNKVILPKGGAE